MFLRHIRENGITIKFITRKSRNIHFGIICSATIELNIIMALKLMTTILPIWGFYCEYKSFIQYYGWSRNFWKEWQVFMCCVLEGDWDKRAVAIYTEMVEDWSSSQSVFTVILNFIYITRDRLNSMITV